MYAFVDIRDVGFVAKICASLHLHFRHEVGISVSSSKNWPPYLFFFLIYAKLGIVLPPLIVLGTSLQACTYMLQVLPSLWSSDFFKKGDKKFPKSWLKTLKNVFAPF